MLEEFKKFIGSGNVMDLAVAVIVGAAMTKIIQSFVDELIVPLVGLLPLPGDLSASYLVLKGDVPSGAALAEARKVPHAVVLGYGQFISTMLTVLITAFAVFLVVKAINKMKAKQVEAPAEAPPPPADVVLLTEIRDLLKSK
ncbi:MAG: large conductance mechanosensitive channel protein MscL [Armatimonas sp.]